MSVAISHTINDHVKTTAHSAQFSLWRPLYSALVRIKLDNANTKQFPNCITHPKNQQNEILLAQNNNNILFMLQVKIKH